MKDSYNTPTKVSQKQQLEMKQPIPRRPIFSHNQTNSQYSLINVENTYISSDGQILQSSMVKAGSPTKRQLTGSTSQVRFSLPPMISDDEESLLDLDDDDLEMDEKEEEKIDQLSYNYSQFNEITTTPTKKPTHHRNTSNISTNTDVYSDNLRTIIQTSPNRQKILLQPTQHHIRNLSVPIPAEILLPPRLSPKKKRDVSGPKSFIFNGIDYEPLEKRFVDDLNYPRREFVIKGETFESNVSGNNMEFSLKPTMKTFPRSLPSSPIKKKVSINKGHRRTKSEFIAIPTESDLNRDQFNVGFGKVVESERIDNEFEIENPSSKAISLNNELNRTFSFPPRGSSTKNKVSTKTDEEMERDIKNVKPLVPAKKQLPSLPSTPISVPLGLQLPSHSPVKQSLPTKGLGLFLEKDEISEKEEDKCTNKFGRFSQIIEKEKPKEEKVSEEEKEQRVYNLENQEDSYIMTESDISKDTISISSIRSNLSLQFSTDLEIEEEAEEDTKSLADSFHSIMTLSTIITKNDDASSIYEDTLSDQEEDQDTSYDLSITSELHNLSLVLTNNNSQQQQEKEEIVESLLFCGGDIIDSESKYEEEESRIEQQMIDTGKLSYYPQPEKLYEIDEGLIPSLEYSTSTSTSKNQSPILSQTSHETVESQPYSNYSIETDLTSIIDNTNINEDQGNDIQVLIDLTNDQYNVTYVKDPRYSYMNGNDSYKSVLETMDNGEIKETIIIEDDDEEEEEEEGYASPSMSQTSHFSFCTVASEVQLNNNTTINIDSSEGIIRKQGFTTPTRQLQRYISPTGKTVIQLCDDTMSSTRDVLSFLNRKGSIIRVNNSRGELDPGVDRFEFEF